MYPLLFACGMMLGSFMNVVTMRYRPEGRFFDFSLYGGRSRCPGCGHTLRWFELVPLLSFAVQRGKCRRCRAPLSFQYPLLELAGGCIVLFTPLFLNSFYGVSAQSFFSLTAPAEHYGIVALWSAACMALLAIAVVDMRHYIIPNELVIALAALGVGIAALTSVFEAPEFTAGSFLKQYAMLFPLFGEGVLLNRFVACLAGGGLFLMLSVGSGGRAMGFGDVKLGFASGLLLGWPDIALAVALSFIAGGAWGGIVLAMRRASLKDKVPFAPFFVLTFFLTFFFGSSILEWYFTLFQI